ncbi:putative hydro-lyase [Breoghania sp.]|uniref:putative hydro-lyase n=1 Tax=Breoghania sp. TaxID=2065378 RepID=UPI002AAC379F|nr:putative hydro-lyase [Breoghania sp.]
MQFSDLASQSAESVRAAIRSGSYAGHTAGLAKGLLQCNLAILPADQADDFLEFCRLNPKSCPLAGVSRPGEPVIERLGEAVDIRTDASLYNIYRNGVLDAQVRDLKAVWRDDLVTFAIGCSFTFENALVKAGITMRHIENNTTVSMYRTNIATAPAGAFGGGMVTSMRPIARERIAEVFDICRKFPIAHGVPVHVGDPAEIGIAAIEKPDWGQPTPVADDEVPVFWACGVTPQVAIMQARPALSITHAPGAMLIADVDEATAPLYPYNDNNHPSI